MNVYYTDPGEFEERRYNFANFANKFNQCRVPPLSPLEKRFPQMQLIQVAFVSLFFHIFIAAVQLCFHSFISSALVPYKDVTFLRGTKGPRLRFLQRRRSRLCSAREACVEWQTLPLPAQEESLFSPAPSPLAPESFATSCSHGAEWPLVSRTYGPSPCPRSVICVPTLPYCPVITCEVVSLKLSPVFREFRFHSATVSVES